MVRQFLGRPATGREPRFMDLAIPVSPRRCALSLVLVVALIIVASVASSFLSFAQISDPFLREVRESVVRLVWVDGEGNIPAWYSAVLLLLCALLLGTITFAQKYQNDGKLSGWAFLTLIFLFLSVDEIAQFHELSIVPLRDRFEMSGFLYYAWILPAALCVTLFALGYLKFLSRLPAVTRQLFLLAGAVYIAGALGVEAISGKQASLHGEQNPTYHAIITIEELLEMLGITLFLYALLDYIGRQFSIVAFHITSDS
jgi:hypothetical protein